MLRNNEIKIKINSFLKSQNYWVKNNSLNFIDEILKSRPLFEYQETTIQNVKKEIELIKIDYYQTHLNKYKIELIKKQLEIIEKLF